MSQYKSDLEKYPDEKLRFVKPLTFSWKSTRRLWSLQRANPICAVEMHGNLLPSRCSEEVKVVLNNRDQNINKAIFPFGLAHSSRLLDPP